MDIKLRSIASYFSTIVLDGASYRLNFYWSTGESVWYLDIIGLSDTTISVNGIALVGGVNLLEPYAINELGELWLIDLSGYNRDPGFDDISTDFVLYYE